MTKKDRQRIQALSSRLIQNWETEYRDRWNAFDGGYVAGMHRLTRAILKMRKS